MAGTAPIRILELANRAWELCEKQEMPEKRRLLDFVCSNSVWRDGALIPNYRKPFDLIVEMQQQSKELPLLDPGHGGVNEKWLPGLDSNQEPPG